MALKQTHLFGRAPVKAMVLPAGLEGTADRYQRLFMLFREIYGEPGAGQALQAKFNDLWRNGILAGRRL